MTTYSETDKSLIRHLIPLNALSNEQMDRILAHITVEKAQNGELLFREGDNDRKHFFLLEGQVKLISGTRDIGLIQSGTPTAKFALAHQWPRKCSGKAAGEVRFIHVDSKILDDLVVDSTHAQHNKPEDANVGWMNLVLRARVLKQVPAANIANVLRRVVERPVKKGEVIINQGDEADEFFIIARGTGIVTRKDPGGDRQLAVLSPGEGFGEDALITGSPRAATVSMASDGTLMRLSKDDFNDLIRRPLVQSIRIEKARPLIQQGAIWVDVRPAEEFNADHFPDAINLPLENLRERCSAYPTEKRKYIVCGPANESAIGTFLLRERGFDVLMLEGWDAVKDSGLTRDSEVAVPSEQISATSEPAAAEKTSSAPAAPDPNTEKQLVRLQKMVAQQVAEITKLRKKLKAVIAENENLHNELKKATESKTDDQVEILQRRIDKLQDELKATREELENAQGIVEESYANESTVSWEFTRIKDKLSNTEQDLARQIEINRLLREENDTLTQRLNRNN